MRGTLHRGTIGILYPGEMGIAFGQLLSDAGFSVITTVEGRSPRTQRMCDNIRCDVVDSLREVVRRSDAILSLVTPAAALAVARRVAAMLEDSPKELLYIDANSISPGTVKEIAEALRPVPVDFVDAAIFGLASQLRQRGTLYLSGSCAHELATNFGSLLRVKAVGDRPGQASALKMIVSGIPKGLSALLLEVMLFAEDMQLLDEALDTCNEIYPSLMEVVNRMLPTYPQHAERRCEELQQVEQTMRSAGSKPRVTQAVRDVTSIIANTSWPTQRTAPWTIAEIVRHVHRQEKPPQHGETILLTSCDVNGKKQADAGEFVHKSEQADPIPN